MNTFFHKLSMYIQFALLAVLVAVETSGTTLPVDVNKPPALGTAYTTLHAQALPHGCVQGKVVEHRHKTTSVQMDRHVSFMQLVQALTGATQVGSRIPLSAYPQAIAVAARYAAANTRVNVVAEVTALTHQRQLQSLHMTQMGKRCVESQQENKKKETKETVDEDDFWVLPTSQTPVDCGNAFVSAHQYGARVVTILSVDFATLLDQKRFAQEYELTHSSNELTVKLATKKSSSKPPQAWLTVYAHQQGASSQQLTQLLKSQVLHCPLDKPQPCLQTFHKVLSYAHKQLHIQLNKTPTMLHAHISSYCQNTSTSLKPLKKICQKRQKTVPNNILLTRQELTSQLQIEALAAAQLQTQLTLWAVRLSGLQMQEYKDLQHSHQHHTKQLTQALQRCWQWADKRCVEQMTSWKTVQPSIKTTSNSKSTGFSPHDSPIPTVLQKDVWLAQNPTKTQKSAHQLINSLYYNRFVRELITLIQKSIIDVRLARGAANAMTLLVAAGVPLNGFNFQGIHVNIQRQDSQGNLLWQGPNLRHGVLQGTNLQGAHVRASNLENTWLVQTLFQNAQLHKTRFGQPVIFKGHKSIVTHAAFHLKTHMLASASCDKSIVLWDTDSAKLLHTLNGHQACVRGVAWGPGGIWLASGSDDKTVKLWHIKNNSMFSQLLGSQNTPQLTYTLQGHTAAVTTVAVGPNQKVIASGGKDNMVIVWDMATGKILHKLKQHKAPLRHVGFDSTGKTLISTDTAGGLLIWNVATGKSIQTLQDESMQGNSYAIFSPNNSVLAWVANNQVKLLNGTKGTTVHALPRYTKQAGACAFDAKGSHLACGDQQGSMQVWDVSTKQSMTMHHKHTLNTCRVVGMQHKPQTGFLTALACPNHVIELYTTANQDELQTYLQPHSWPTWNKKPICDVACAPNSNTALALACDGSAALWNLHTQALLHTFKPRARPIVKAAVVNNGTHIVLVYADGLVRVWDGKHESFKQIPYSAQVSQAGVNPQTGHVALARPKGSLTIHNTQKSHLTQTLSKHLSHVHQLAFRADGKALVCVDGLHNTVQLWKSKDVSPKPSFENVKTFSHCIGCANSMAIHPQKDHIVCGSTKGAIRLWNAQTGRLQAVVRQDEDSVDALAYNPQGDLLASSNAHGSIVVYKAQDLLTKKIVHSWQAHSTAIKKLSWGRGGSVLISLGADNIVRVWDVKTAHLLSTSGYLPTYTQPTTCQKAQGMSESTRQFLSKDTPISFNN